MRARATKVKDEHSNSFDVYMWQTLKTKAKFIAQVMSGDMTVRRLEDMDSAALTYAEVKAIASGKPVHFLGPLVCTLPPRLPGNSSTFQLIDGQQRVTTLTILLAAIRDVARSRNLNDFAEEVTEDYLLFKRKQGSDRYKVLPRLMQSVIGAISVPMIKKSTIRP
jgi:hypothetical protein